MKHLKYLFAALATIAVLAIFSSCSSDKDDKKDDEPQTPAITAADFNGTWRCFDGTDAVQYVFTGGTDFTRDTWVDTPEGTEKVTIEGTYTYNSSKSQIVLRYVDEEDFDRVTIYPVELKDEVLRMLVEENKILVFHKMGSGPAPDID